MTKTAIPYLLDASQLRPLLHDPGMRIVEVGTSKDYSNFHIPGAVFLDAEKLRLHTRPASGLLPDLPSLTETLRSAGIDGNTHIVVYDHDYNAEACRFLWVLEAVFHQPHSLLNGGMPAWLAESGPIETAPNRAPRSTLDFQLDDRVIADRSDVLQSLGQEKIRILDARSPAEYSGLKSSSARKGHIPGAVNVHWLDTMDHNNARRLHAPEILTGMLENAGIHPENEIIVYCQTHRRSSHSYMMLRSMGYPQVRGYAGSWSEWGNDPDLPIE